MIDAEWVDARKQEIQAEVDGLNDNREKELERLLQLQGAFYMLNEVSNLLKAVKPKKEKHSGRK